MSDPASTEPAVSEPASTEPATGTLEEYEILDSEPEDAFDELVALVARRFGSSHAELSIVAEDRVWLKAGLADVGVSRGRDESFCTSVVADRDIIVVPDAEMSERFAGHLRVGIPGGVRFYAGAPLITPDGVALGAVCVWDEEPLAPSVEDVAVLQHVARMAMALLELRRSTLRVQRRDALIAANTAVLDMIVGGVDLGRILDRLALAVEASMPRARLSVLRRDDERLVDVAGSRVPEGYRQNQDGLLIGSRSGPCGLAAATGVIEIVPDVALEERWGRWREVALEHGLRSCWAVPILAGQRVLGVFGIHHDVVRSPTDEELQQLGLWVNLAEVAITRAADVAALRDAASLDDLTGLINRPTVLRVLDDLTARPGDGVSVLFLDLDQFKFINDTFGHAAGDEFLTAVARRLVGAATADETVARFGGDEFLVISRGVSDAAAAQERGRRLVAALRRPLTYAGRTVSLSVSVGIAVHAPGAVAAAVDLVRDADLAMYAAKRSGRNSVSVFTDQLRRLAALRLSMEGALDRALADGVLDCDYQPIVDLASGRMLGIEALLRWRSPGQPEIPPSTFVTAAEDSGQIFALGEFVLRRACTTLTSLRAAGEHWTDLTLWINISPRQLRDPGFADLVGTVLAETGLPADRLGLEVTETSFILDAPTAIAALSALRATGVRVAIDDFGTGYSSLAQLRELPADVLKIDRQFVTDLGGTQTGPGIVEAIITLARILGLAVIAEGVETDLQRQRLLDLGCPAAQGFLWARPLRAAHLALGTAFLAPREQSVGVPR